MELTERRTLPAPAERVWSALTDAGSLAAWFWPERFETVAETDPRPGGAFRIAGRGLAVAGVYTDVEKPERLAFTWQWDGDDLVTSVRVVLCDGELVLTHDGFPDAGSRDDHVTGWSDCLDRLSDWLADSRAAGTGAG
jgi:uncharacterized protein YndB with AHSA1/START domain